MHYLMTVPFLRMAAMLWTTNVSPRSFGGGSIGTGSANQQFPSAEERVRGDLPALSANVSPNIRELTDGQAGRDGPDSVEGICPLLVDRHGGIGPIFLGREGCGAATRAEALGRTSATAMQRLGA